MKILSWNIANYDNHLYWENRKELLVEEIIKVNPDIIALQEIRFNIDHPSTRKSYLNSAEQVLIDLQKKELFKQAKIITHPAMYYDFPTFWEGLSIITKTDIIESGNIFYTLLHSSSDRNQRITQYAVLASENSVFTLFNTHFSYDEFNLRLNIGETINYMQRFAGYPCILVGDMNAIPLNEDIQKLKMEGLTDVWQKFYPKSNGFTFPADNPQKRIDYVWISEDIVANKIELVGMKPDKQGIFPSDHLGLAIEINT